MKSACASLCVSEVERERESIEEDKCKRRMNNQYVGSTPLRGGGGGAGVQADDVRLNLSSVGGATAGMYATPSRTGPATINNNSAGMYYSSGLANSSIGAGGPYRQETDTRSIASTPSKISKFTYCGELKKTTFFLLKILII